MKTKHPSPRKSNRVTIATLLSETSDSSPYNLAFELLYGMARLYYNSDPNRRRFIVFSECSLAMPLRRDQAIRAIHKG